MGLRVRPTVLGGLLHRAAQPAHAADAPDPSRFLSGQGSVRTLRNVGLCGRRHVRPQLMRMSLGGTPALL
jgi:hypothetical protein